MRSLHVSNPGPNAPVPHVQRRILLLTGTAGAAAFALAVTGEFTRTQYYQIRQNAPGQLACYYEPSSATLFGSLAVVALTFAQVISASASGLSWSRPLFQRHMVDNKAVVGRAVQRVAILAIMDLLFYLAAIGVLIAASVENKYHVSAVPYGQMFMSCSVVSEGIFFSGGLLAVIATILMVVYYYYSVRANEELWLCNYVAAPVVLDMEAFSREAARTSITAIISDRRDSGGSSSSSPGKMDSMSNTPITHARLA